MIKSCTFSNKDTVFDLTMQFAHRKSNSFSGATKRSKWLFATSLWPRQTAACWITGENLARMFSKMRWWLPQGMREVSASTSAMSCRSGEVVYSSTWVWACLLSSWSCCNMLNTYSVHSNQTSRTKQQQEGCWWMFLSVIKPLASRFTLQALNLLYRFSTKSNKNKYM